MNLRATANVAKPTWSSLPVTIYNYIFVTGAKYFGKPKAKTRPAKRPETMPQPCARSAAETENDCARARTSPRRTRRAKAAHREQGRGRAPHATSSSPLWPAGALSGTCPDAAVLSLSVPSAAAAAAVAAMSSADPLSVAGGGGYCERSWAVGTKRPRLESKSVKNSSRRGFWRASLSLGTSYSTCGKRGRDRATSSKSVAKRGEPGEGGQHRAEAAVEGGGGSGHKGQSRGQRQR